MSVSSYAFRVAVKSVFFISLHAIFSYYVFSWNDFGNQTVFLNFFLIVLLLQSEKIVFHVNECRRCDLRHCVCGFFLYDIAQLHYFKNLSGRSLRNICPVWVVIRTEVLFKLIEKPGGT